MIQARSSYADQEASRAGLFFCYAA